MSEKKQLIRQQFRDACFKRDKFCCAKCGFKSSKENVEKELDAHHIQSRKDMPSGGYVPENGISLCSECHLKAEEFYTTGLAITGYSINELFNTIGSSLEVAINASKKLK
ncbi:HNHc domain containing protein [uncultured Caudovirales phage]|uniref:HNHc domain containing protein n=1 Tax=uncultured Caudovirales phage TaxID=2100421 RepID=A0A6J5RH88_9CAUD|nr:HNHc domain containing protein [uncultured Caudovirales phage]